MRRHEIHIGTHIEGKKLEERHYGITAGKKEDLYCNVPNENKKELRTTENHNNT